MRKQSTSQSQAAQKGCTNCTCQDHAPQQQGTALQGQLQQQQRCCCSSCSSCRSLVTSRASNISTRASTIDNWPVRFDAAAGRVAEDATNPHKLLRGAASNRTIAMLHSGQSLHCMAASLGSWTNRHLLPLKQSAFEWRRPQRLSRSIENEAWAAFELGQQGHDMLMQAQSSSICCLCADTCRALRYDISPAAPAHEGIWHGRQNCQARPGPSREE